LCRKFFDPLTRGGTLRERLAKLQETPQRILRASYAEPLVKDVGSGTLIVGIEARLLLAALQEVDTSGHTVLSPSVVAGLESAALAKYRSWSSARLDQVVALRTGNATEVMQAVSVGLVVALLVNRSDAPERAIPRLATDTLDGEQVNGAIYAGAERFASAIVPNRSGRSASEKRLKGGYGLSEASRRLAHRLVIDKRPVGDFVHVSSEHRNEVIEFLGADLSRRSALSEESLSDAFEQLVAAFRESAGKLAHRALIFERSADTRNLKDSLTAAFARARVRRERESE